MLLYQLHFRMAGFATMTHLDSLGRESDFSNRAYFTMRFGPPVIIDLNFE